MPYAISYGCRICRTALTVHQKVRGGVCDKARCKQTALMQDLAKRSREEKAALVQRAETWGRQLVASRQRRRGAEPDAESVAVAVLPSNDLPITRLPASRRRAFREKLLELVAESAQERDPPDRRPTPVSPLQALACATCRGHCCRGGGEHAYLDGATIKRHAAAHPELTLNDVLDDYMARLPARSFEGSCVYHAARGCTLPREMRADICNEFACDGLKAFTMRLTSSPPREAVTVASSRARFVRATVVDADGIRWRWRAPGEEAGAGDEPSKTGRR